MSQSITAETAFFKIDATADSAVRPLSASDFLSLTALVTYVAYQLNVDEDNILRDLLDQFDAMTLASLPYIQFDQAIAYLVDQVPDSARADPGKKIMTKPD